MRRFEASLRTALREETKARLMAAVGEKWLAKEAEARRAFWATEIIRLERELRSLLAGHDDDEAAGLSALRASS